MSELAVGGVPAAAWRAPDTRRQLQLALGALWLLDANLQAQSITRAFGHMLAGSAPGNRLPTLARVSAWRPAAAALAPATPGPAAALASSSTAGRPASAVLAAPWSAGSSSPTALRPPLSPRLASCCNIVMGLVMAYMLIVSL